MTGPVLVLDVVGMTPRLLAHMPRLSRLAADGFCVSVRPPLPALTCSSTKEWSAVRRVSLPPLNRYARESPTCAMFITPSSASAATTVVPMPFSSGDDAALSLTALLASLIAATSLLPARPSVSTSPKGQVMSSLPAVARMKPPVTSTAIRLASSPAAWPPIPSATTYRPVSGNSA